MVIVDEPAKMIATPVKSNALVLYHHRYSFYSQKVLLALHEKKLEFREREVDITSGEQYGSWFLDLNPRGEVPVLQDGDKIIPDSTHIIDYIEYRFRGENIPSLLPSDPAKMCEILELRKAIDQLPGNVLTVGSFYHKELVDKPKLPFIPPVRWLLRRAEKNSAVTLRMNAEKNKVARDILLRKASAQERTHEIVENSEKFTAAINQVDKVLGKVEDALTPGPWLGESQFTVADVSLAVLLERLTGLGLDTKLWGNKQQIKLYYERLQKRESYKAAIPQGWLPLVSLVQWQGPALATAVLSALVTGAFILKRRH